MDLRLSAEHEALRASVAEFARKEISPVIGDLYTDQELTAKLPYLPTLLESIKSAEPRPVTPFYPAVTKAIQDNTYAALKGSKSVDSAMQDMQAALTSATDGSGN